jgi:polyphenol oxidase
MQRIHSQDLIYYQFDSFAQSPELDHGMFTRFGGVSSAPFDSLNIGSTVGDDLDCVMENRRRMAGAFALSDDETRTAHQVHGADVIIVDATTPQITPPPPADGMITRSRNLGIVMRFADCVPVLLYDPVQHAIGLAHAGWRGTIQRTGSATAQAMIDQFGSRPQDLIAGIGPSIGPCCYEVGPEVVEAVRNAFPTSDALISPLHDGHSAHLDLWSANEIALRELGVSQISVSQICTSCGSEFYSHRRDAGKTGRFGVLMNLRAEG